MCFHLEEAPLLFSGDTLFPGGPGATKFPGGDFATIIASIDRRLFAPLAADTVVLPATVARAAVVVASSVSGKHSIASMPKDFRRRRDARLLWVGVILLLLVGIAFASWKFYHALFHKG